MGTKRKENPYLLDLQSFLNPTFFSNNKEDILNTITTYRTIKQQYAQDGEQMFRNKENRLLYTKFYKMHPIFVSDEFRSRLFRLKKSDLVTYRDIANWDTHEVKKITFDRTKSNGSKKGRQQLSFFTTILSLIDDKHYPIYNSSVGFIFTNYRYVADYKIEQKIEIYKEIKTTYDYYLDKNNSKNQLSTIKIFKDTFSCNDLSNMRVLDIMIWELGKHEQKSKKGEGKKTSTKK